MGHGEIALTSTIHVLAFMAALVELLLRCFRRRKPPSEQDRPLVLSAETSGERSSSDQHVDAVQYLPQTPPGTAKPSDLEEEPTPQVPALTEQQRSSTNGNQLAHKQNTVGSKATPLSLSQVNHSECSSCLTVQVGIQHLQK